MRFSMYMAVTGGVVNIVLNLFLIPKYGGLGAAIATVVSQMLASYIMHAIFPITRNIFIRQTKAILMVPLLKRAMLLR